jgi:hypothetical protein
MTDILDDLARHSAEADLAGRDGSSLDEAAETIRALRANLAAAEALVADCFGYLKEGETPRQRMDRDQRDVLALMEMLAKDRAERDALRARLAPIVALADRIADDAAKATKGPWTAYNMVHADRGDQMTPEEIGEYVCNSVKMGDPSRFLFVSGKHDVGGDADICHVGNGPRGPANVNLIAAAPDMVAAILAAGGRA